MDSDTKACLTLFAIALLVCSTIGSCMAVCDFNATRLEKLKIEAGYEEVLEPGQPGEPVRVWKKVE